MRLASVPLVILLLLSTCIWAVGQAPPPEPHDQQPPPPREAHDGFGPRGEDQRSHDRRGHGKPLNEEQAREALEVLRRIDPEKAQSLEKAIEDNPEQIGRILGENFPNIGRFMAWRRYDPEGFDLRIQDLALSRQTHACANRLREALDAEDDEIAALEQIRLADLVADHFDVRQQLREYELAKLRNQIEELLAQLEERSNNRDQFIEERIGELMGVEGEDRW